MDTAKRVDYVAIRERRQAELELAKANVENANKAYINADSAYSDYIAANPGCNTGNVGRIASSLFGTLYHSLQEAKEAYDILNAAKISYAVAYEAAEPDVD